MRTIATWDKCRMLHEKDLPSIHRVAVRRVEIAHALNLKDESEITAAIEEINHVLYSALLVFRQVDRLASEAKQGQVLLFFTAFHGECPKSPQR